MKNVTRRDFLKQSAVLGASACCAQALHGLLGTNIVHAQSTAGTGNKLLLLFLNGGNDDANTCIAMNESTYFSSRPNIAIPAPNILSAASGWGFHPSMVNIRARFLQNQVAAIPGFGTLNPQRSHEEESRKFQLANGKSGGPGWIGAAADIVAATGGSLGVYNSISLGGGTAPELVSARSANRPLSYSNLPTTLGTDETGSAETNSRQLSHKGILDNLSLVSPRMAHSKTAYRNMYDQLAALNNAINTFPGGSTAAYGNSGIGNRLRQFAAIFRAEGTLDGSQSTQVGRVEIGGFDTHSDQVTLGNPLTGGHATLWTQIDTAIGRFLTDMETFGMGNRVAILIFSEFGRNAKENGSRGTDHGNGATGLVIGPQVTGGFRTSPWSSTVFTSNANILPVTVHFHNAYREILQDWLGWPVPPMENYTQVGLNLFT